MLPLRDDSPTPPGFKPRVTQALIAANVAVFILEVMWTGQFLDFSNQRAITLFYNWGAVPSCVTGADVLNINFGLGPVMIECPSIWFLPLVSSIFLHGGLIHLGGNMLFLWIFGDNMEQKFGRMRFLAIYMAWGVAAGLAHIYGDTSSAIPAVGASGAISGVLGAYLVILPRAKIHTVMIFGFFIRSMEIPAKWYLPFWLVYQNLLPFFIDGFGVGTGGVAYLAHIGGFAVGLATGYLYRRTHESEYMYGTRYGYRP